MWWLSLWWEVELLDIPVRMKMQCSTGQDKDNHALGEQGEATIRLLLPVLNFIPKTVVKPQKKKLIVV